MIIIQSFPTVAALVGFLNNARLRQGKRRFADWLTEYTRGRDLVVNGRLYRVGDCINLLNMEGVQNVG